MKTTMEDDDEGSSVSYIGSYFLYGQLGPILWLP
jgi:hypothetical protein